VLRVWMITGAAGRMALLDALVVLLVASGAIAVLAWLSDHLWAFGRSDDDGGAANYVRRTSDRLRFVVG
jgi:hypothetical protein